MANVAGSGRGALKKSNFLNAASNAAMKPFVNPALRDSLMASGARRPIGDMMGGALREGVNEFAGGIRQAIEPSLIRGLMNEAAEEALPPAPSQLMNALGGVMRPRVPWEPREAAPDQKLWAEAFEGKATPKPKLATPKPKKTPKLGRRTE